MNKIIITGHGKYAVGMMSSLEMLIGKNENIIGINFGKNDSDQKLAGEFKKVLNKKDNFIFVCDLLGGTPYKVASLLASEVKNIKVVTGANIGGILDTSLKMAKMSLTEAAENLIEASDKNLVLIGKIGKKVEKSNEGI